MKNQISTVAYDSPPFSESCASGSISERAGRNPLVMELSGALEAARAGITHRTSAEDVEMKYAQRITQIFLDGDPLASLFARGLVDGACGRNAVQISAVYFLGLGQGRRLRLRE